MSIIEQKYKDFEPYKITLSSGKEITLNDQQVEALQKIDEFLKQKRLLEDYETNPDFSNFFCLQGSAGSGKTTIVKEAIKNCYSVAVTAPTHKAKKVIAKITGLSSETIHSLIGLKPDVSLDDFSKTNLLFSRDEKSKCRMEDYELIVIDEASMINKDLLFFIKQQVKIYGKKVLFMGDANQLPPVKEKEASIFSDSEIKQFRLTKTERQKEGNPLIAVYDAILSNINSEKDLYKKETVMKENNGVSFIDNSDAFKALLEIKFKNIELDNKILCWSNEQVRRWNLMMRKMLIPDAKEPISINEVFMAYSTLRDVKDFKKIILQNSSEYKLLSFGDKSIHEIYEDDNRQEKRVNINVYKCRIENADHDLYDINYINILKKDPENIKKFVEIEGILHDRAMSCRKESKKWMWKEYYDFKNKYVILGDIEDSNGGVLVKKDIDYCYAITVHKSQGSTYDNVFIDEKDLNRNQNPSERNRLKYVAFSRPSMAAIVYYTE